jgi:hypothetical protein
MRWADMPLCGLHDHVICAKHYLFGQAKPGLPEFADAVLINCNCIQDTHLASSRLGRPPAISVLQRERQALIIGWF